MATTQVSQRPRPVKKLEKPRPPKLNQRHSTIDGRITTADDLVTLINNVVSHLTNGFHDPNLQANIVPMCNALKHCAPQLEAVHKDQLDRAFVAIRNGSRDERLDVTTRVHLLELIELRSKQWRHKDTLDAYYNHKCSNYDDNDVHNAADTPTTPIGGNFGLLTSIQAPPVLAAGEVIKNSGKFAKPTRIPGKNYCKDEVVIRNSDSGKVMGIKGRRVHMIEELSETIISFQRVNPGAKERLVQITGTSEDKIHYAKDLIKDTIQRNASPVRLEHVGVDRSGIGGSSSSLNSSASDESNRLHQQQQHNSRSRTKLLHSLSTNDASIGEYKYTVTVGHQVLKITGCNHDLVRTAKLVLDEHFSRWTGDADQFTRGIDYFTFEEEAGYPTSIASGLLRSPSGNMSIQTRETSMESNNTSESEETYKLQSVKESPKKKNENRELTYEFLLLCATGPYAKRPPPDWERIQRECPTIVRKKPIRWFEPDIYRASVVAAGIVTVLPIGEIDGDE